MKTFFSKLLHDTASRVIVVALVAGGALFLPQVRSFLALLLDPIEVPGWVLLASLLSGAFGLAYLIKDRVGPAYVRKYQKEEIDGIVWRWGYSNGRVTGLRGFCSKAGCDTELMLTVHQASLAHDDQAFRGTQFYCTSCNQSGAISNAMDLPDHERRKIEKRIRDNSWKTVAKKP